MTGGRKRVGIWHRHRHHRTAEQPETPPVTVQDLRPGDGATPTGPDPPTSLDQVLRRAAEARGVEREQDG